MDTLTPAAPALTDPDALIAQIAAGNLQAFERLMRTHNRRLFRVARSILLADGDAEDAVQEAYLRAFVALKSYRGAAQLATWLTRIVINEALAKKRQQKNAGLRLEGDTALGMDNNPSLNAIESCFHRLRRIWPCVNNCGACSRPGSTACRPITAVCLCCGPWKS